jgi:hypothetical protein
MDSLLPPWESLEKLGKIWTEEDKEPRKFQSVEKPGAKNVQGLVRVGA